MTSLSRTHGKIAAPTRPPNAARVLRDLFGGIQHGELTLIDPHDQAQLFRGAQPGPRATLVIRDWCAAGAMLQRAEIGLAEAWRDGAAEFDDPCAFLLLCAANERAFAAHFHARPWWALLYRLKHWARSNTRHQARRNIAAHYDLSNDFYALWLDPGMTYSSALFAAAGSADDDAELERAQEAKYARMLAQLDARPGAHVLEIGSGWGGFAEYAARHHGLRVTGITLSQAQLDFARARIARAGLGGQVDLQLIDYRDITGQYDHIVSIEMFEAVGERYWKRFFSAVHDRLRPGGSAALQAITIAPEHFAQYRRGSDFIREYIFPGGMLAPTPRMVADASAAGLACGQPFSFGLHYAATLAQWHGRFRARAAPLQELGFDAGFQRLWRFYLAYCEAGFRAGRTDVIQLGLARPR